MENIRAASNWTWWWWSLPRSHLISDSVQSIVIVQPTMASVQRERKCDAWFIAGVDSFIMWYRR